ncbi:MAG: pseudouridine synthase [Acidimicrobiia bacterium]|nr:pseudouridine synthase [Acidimicrobiia bacterium]
MSRRRAEDLIRDGRVTVDGRTAVLGDRGDPATATVAIDGVPIPVRPDLVYVLLNKPEGVVSTAADPQGRETVVDLVDVGTRVYPVGRLDIDSEGLLLLTNDGTLANLVTHPRYGIKKVYLALVRGTPGKAALRRLTEGVELDDGTARAVTASVRDRHRDKTLVEIAMAEGKKREVRRMLDAVGHPVLRLARTAIGPIRDSRLEPGAWRRLTIQEINALYSEAGATWQDAPAIASEVEAGE